MTADWLAPRANPAQDYADAAARVAALQARDTAGVDPRSRMQCLTHGAQADRAIVFFHGSRWPERDPRGGWATHVSLGLAWSEDLAAWHWPGNPRSAGK